MTGCLFKIVQKVLISKKISCLITVAFKLVKKGFEDSVIDLKCDFREHLGAPVINRSFVGFLYDFGSQYI